MLHTSARSVILAAALMTATLPAAAEDTALRTFLRRTIGLTDAQVAEIDSGRVVTRKLQGADKPEMAAFGAVRVAAKKDVYLERLRDVPRFRNGPSTIQIGRFHTPPVIADLDSLTLEDGDLDAARKCKPGDCDLKLARTALDRIQKEMDWKAADARARANQLMKQMLVEYVTAYRGAEPRRWRPMSTTRPLSEPRRNSARSWPRRPISWNTLLR